MSSIIKAAKLIQSSEKICILTGPGISTAAHIPDLDSDEEKKQHRMLFDLKHPDKKSDHLYKLPWIYALYRRSMAAEPTKTHQFIQELSDSGKLIRCYTQNADGLERGLTSDISSDSVQCVRLNGTFHSLRCISCGQAFPTRDFVLPDGIRIHDCPSCVEGPGEAPTYGKLLHDLNYFKGNSSATLKRIMQLSSKDAETADLFLIIGNSLLDEGVREIAEDIAYNIRGRMGKGDDDKKNIIFINKTQPTMSLHWCTSVQIDCDAFVDVYHKIVASSSQKPGRTRPSNAHEEYIDKIKRMWGPEVSAQFEKGCPQSLLGAIVDFPSCRWEHACMAMQKIRAEHGLAPEGDPTKWRADDIKEARAIVCSDSTAVGDSGAAGDTSTAGELAHTRPTKHHRRKSWEDPAPRRQKGTQRPGVPPVLRDPDSNAGPTHVPSTVHRETELVQPADGLLGQFTLPEESLYLLIANHHLDNRVVSTAIQFLRRATPTSSCIMVEPSSNSLFRRPPGSGTIPIFWPCNTGSHWFMHKIHGPHDNIELYHTQSEDLTTASFSSMLDRPISQRVCWSQFFDEPPHPNNSGVLVVLVMFCHATGTPLSRNLNPDYFRGLLFELFRADDGLPEDIIPMHDIVASYPLQLSDKRRLSDLYFFLKDEVRNYEEHLYRVYRIAIKSQCETRETAEEARNLFTRLRDSALALGAPEDLLRRIKRVLMVVEENCKCWKILTNWQASNSSSRSTMHANTPTPSLTEDVSDESGTPTGGTPTDVPSG